MSDATTPLDAELAALWAALPLGERSAAAALRTLAESTGIDEAVIERHWREALLTEVAQLAAAEVGRQVADAGLERPGSRGGHGLGADPRRRRRALPAAARPGCTSCSPEFEREVAAPLRAVFERAQAEGAIRDDVPLEQLGASLRGLLGGDPARRPAEQLDLDAAGAAVARLFLEAARQ